MYIQPVSYTHLELRIGASTTISQYVLPELIAEFRKLYPDIRITLLSGNSHEDVYKRQPSVCAGS